jgi:hypothetical protein
MPLHGPVVLDDFGEGWPKSLQTGENGEFLMNRRAFSQTVEKGFVKKRSSKNGGVRL